MVYVSLGAAPWKGRGRCTSILNSPSRSHLTKACNLYHPLARPHPRFLQPAIWACTTTKLHISTAMSLDDRKTLLHRAQENLLDLQTACTDLMVSKPEVAGLTKMKLRILKELEFSDRLRHSVAHGGDIDHASEDFGTGRQVLLAAQLQGLQNNVQGISAELAAAIQAPGVVAVGRQFSAVAPELLSGSKNQVCARCEVDIVAQNGHAWLEIKSSRPFTLGSQQWSADDGHNKGLARQAADHVKIAAAPCNQLRWRAPSVVYHFPAGCSEEVSEELQRLGIKVTGPGPIREADLPPAPPPPQCVNADVTTLCAMVSEVTNRTPCLAMHSWAARIPQWQESVEAEKTSQLSQELIPLLFGRQLFVANTAVSKFEELLSKMGGPLERRRWLQLRPLLHIVCIDSHIPEYPPADPPWAHPGMNSLTADSSDLETVQRDPISDSSGFKSQKLTTRLESFGQFDSDLCWAAKALTAWHTKHPGKQAEWQQHQGTCAFSHSAQVLQQHVSTLRLDGNRVLSLARLPQAVKTVLALGDIVQALTLTANGRSVAVAAAQGVTLEARVHRPAWLTGM